jgi:glutathione S-transferase
MAKIKLHQFPPASGLPVSASPYCVRVEVYLRLTDREFEVVEASDPRKSPTKEVPWVTFADGSVMGDSGKIIEHLEAEGPSLDEWLSDEQRTQSRELIERVDAPIYFSSLYYNFVDDEGWARQKKYIGARLPWALRLFLPAIIRKTQVVKCAKHGFTDRSDYGKAVTAIGELSEALGDKPFLMGDEPAVADCCLWPQLLGCMNTDQSTPARDAARGDDRLQDYMERVAERVGLKIPSYR